MQTPWRLPLVVLTVVLVQAACSSSGEGGTHEPEDTWGPLAVVPPAQGGADALNVGMLRITDSCVFLDTAGGESELLVWPADRTRWDGTAAAIRFTNSAGTEVTLGDGELVTLGGGGDSTRESGVSAEEWIGRVDWVAAPDTACPTETRWFVNDVVSTTPTASLQPYEVVGSREYPGVEIACQGAVRLSGDACRAWGEELLSDPTRPTDVTRLVLTANAGDARCAADFYVAHDRPPAVMAAVVCPSSSPLPADGTPPPLNDLEARIVDALASLGIDGQRMEYSPTSAFIWSPLGGDSSVSVHAYPTATDGGEFTVVSERVVAGRMVQHVEYSTGPLRERFECDGVTYEAEGAIPPGFASFDDFLTDLIVALGCGEHQGP